MKQKKIFLALLMLCLALTFTVFAACTKQEPEKPKEDINSKISQKIDAYTTDLRDSAESMQSSEAILTYLSAWADAKKIRHRTDKAGNLIFTRAASAGYEDAEPTVLICPCDYKQYQECVPPLAMALYLIKNADEAGKLTIIFTPSEGDRYEALSGVEKKYLPEDARILTLNPGEKGVFATGSAAGSSYRLEIKGKRIKPQLNTAYRISLTGLPTGLPDSRIENVPNPIEELEGIMTWINNKKKSFEIASFRGGIDPALYAPGAELVITIDANDEEAFLEKMESFVEDWQEQYGQKYPDAEYTWEKTELPGKVYDVDTTHKLVSYIYTLLNGEYHRDESDSLISICNLSMISTDKKAIRMWSSAYSLDETSLKEIDIDEMTLANLSGAVFTTTHTVPLWTGVEESEFTEAIKNSYDKTARKSLHYQPSVSPTCCAQVQALTGAPDLISITVSENIVKECTATLLDYMAALVETEED